MRNVLCQSLLSHAENPNLVFLTGDLGFQALEPLRDAMGRRFINAGVAEQNMVSVAAGLARTNMRPWVYSIAPFLYARPYEQIRNDVCMHGLPVTMVGNGGGYAYGVMGGTHHALEDYGALLCLSGLRAYIPAFAADVPPTIDQLMTSDRPAYLRLGRCELPKPALAPAYAPWRRLMAGGGPTILVVGPLVGGLWTALESMPDDCRPSLWILTELPIDESIIPTAFLDDLRASTHLFVIEEHVVQGGAGQMLALALASIGKMPSRFTHRCARGYPSGRYGSQSFHRKECGLDAESILSELGGLG